MSALSDKGAKIGVRDPSSPSGSNPRGPEPAGSAQEIRTIPLGPSGGVHGVREFTVILSSSGVTDAKAAGTQPQLKNDDAIIHRLETKSWWPANSSVKLVRQGVLSCQDGKCEFVYIPF